MKARSSRHLRSIDDDASRASAFMADIDADTSITSRASTAFPLSTAILMALNFPSKIENSGGKYQSSS
jgi:hypothetical protein